MNSRPAPERPGARQRSRRARAARWSTLAAVTLACALVPSAALAGTANKGLKGAPASNPIADMTWGHYTGSVDKIYPTYEAAKGTAKRLLGEVALRPEAYWFGGFNSNPEGAAAGYIAGVTHGDSDVLAQVSSFRLGPWESRACGVYPSSSEVSSYESWTRAFATGIGNSRVLLVLQPDLPVATDGCISSAARKKYAQMITFAAKTFSALPYTTVYIDAGSSDWLSPSADAALLAKFGITHARGFGLDATHFDSTDHEINYGAKVVHDLASRGIKGVHFIVDTAENGHPFTHQQYTKHFGSGAHYASRPACVAHKHVAFCQTFGIPPTWDVALAQWHLGSHDDALARKYVDGYVWFGRPWMQGQAGPFNPSLTEGMARSTPFPYPKYVGPDFANIRARTSRSALTWPTNL